MKFKNEYIFFFYNSYYLDVYFYFIKIYFL